MIIVNAPFFVSAISKIFTPFLPDSLASQIVVYSSEWPSLGEHVPLKMLPEEYGGFAGELKRHDEEFNKKVLAFNSFLEMRNE
ncbi:hypothetical protein CHUAL_001129 [Chamberlinius hualienensis]